MWPVTDILKVAAQVRVETEWRTGTVKSQWMRQTLQILNPRQK